MDPLLGVTWCLISASIVKYTFDPVEIKMTICHTIRLQSSTLGTHKLFGIISKIWPRTEKRYKVPILRFENPNWRL